MYICAIAHLVWQSPLLLYQCAVKIMLHRSSRAAGPPQQPTRQQFLTPGLTTLLISAYSEDSKGTASGRLKAKIRAGAVPVHLPRL